MRTLSNRLIPFLVGLLAFLILSPAFANAENRSWTMAGSELTKAETVEPIINFGFAGAAGGFTCPAKAKIQLSPGSTGSVEEFFFPNSAECKFSGGLAAICGEELESHAITGLPWTVHGTTTGGTRSVRVTGVELDLKAPGEFCPEINLSGELVATPDDPDEMFELALSGTFSTNFASSMTATGAMYFFPTGAKTYGISTTATPPTRALTHEGIELPKAATVEAHGTFGFVTESFGGFSCPTVADLHFGPGNTGTVTSFKPTPTSNCTYSGQMDAWCGTVDTHSTPGLPWVIHPTKFPDGSYGFRVAGFQALYGGTGVFCPDLKFDGELMLKGNPHSLSTLTVSGNLFTSFGEPLPASGSMALTPSGTYTLAT